MKKQDTAAFSLIRCDTEKKMPALAVRAIRAALFFAGLLAVAQGAAGIWTNYGWLWAAAGAAALVWQSVALGLPRRWLRAVLPLLCLICAAVFSGRFLAGAVTVSSAAAPERKSIELSAAPMEETLRCGILFGFPKFSKKIEKNLKKRLTNPERCAIIYKSKRDRGSTENKAPIYSEMDRWLSWSKAHDWKSCND